VTFKCAAPGTQVEGIPKFPHSIASEKFNTRTELHYSFISGLFNDITSNEDIILTMNEMRI
jgi:hypothetical protein